MFGMENPGSRRSFRIAFYGFCTLFILSWLFTRASYRVSNPVTLNDGIRASDQHDHVSRPGVRNAISTNVRGYGYLEMALVLGYSLKKFNPWIDNGSTDLVLLVSHDADIPPEGVAKAEAIGWKLRFEDEVPINGTETLWAGFQRNFFKYRAWTWTEYRKVVLLDADTVCLGDISLLVSDGFDFGAVPDTWTHSMPDVNFNAGVLSLTPSVETYDRLLNHTESRPLPWDAEQGVLNSFFPLPTPERLYPHQYTRMALPIKYNLNIEAERSHLDQWRDVWPDARIVHYTQSKAWWSIQCAEDTNCTFHQSISRWFEIRNEMNSVHSDWVPLDPPRYN